MLLVLLVQRLYAFCKASHWVNKSGLQAHFDQSSRNCHVSSSDQSAKTKSVGIETGT